LQAHSQFKEPKAEKSSPAKEFETGLGYLSGVSGQNVAEGLRHIRSSADQGYAPAQDALGAMYDEGQFVTRDPQQAISWYKKAASQGDNLAAMALGYFYFTGVGVSRDLDAAKKWFSTAADSGDPISQYYIGLIAEQKDYTKAPDLFRKAAQQGLVQAQVKLAAALDSGRGVTRDPVESFIWYLIAADPGGAPVSTEAAKLEAEIGSTAAQQARERAVSLRVETNRARNSLGCFDWPGREQTQPTPPPLSAQPSCRR
jgi:TPR repeat protein